MDSETFISCQNDAISPSKFLSQEEIQNVNNSPNSCVSYEDMEPSFTVGKLSNDNYETFCSAFSHFLLQIYCL